MSAKIILASASPRRRELMARGGIACDIVPAHVNEDIPEGTQPRIACMYNALKKAQDVAAGHEDSYVIGADTIVWDGRILGKPVDEADAFRTLAELRNRTHSVYTGMCIILASQRITRIFYEKTDVVFGDYSDDDIRAYIKTGEPMDKAGSYAVQGAWSEHVTEIRGSRDNVIGLPVDRIAAELDRLGADMNF